jgi:hypothetical protein
MPMIDVCATSTFHDKHALAQNLAAAVGVPMRGEHVDLGEARLPREL